MTSESFRHYYEDGYLFNGGWGEIYYAGIYRNTNGMPYQWNKLYKKSKPIALFTSSQWRGNKADSKKCWYGCSLRYRYSAN